MRRPQFHSASANVTKCRAASFGLCDAALAPCSGPSGARFNGLQRGLCQDCNGATCSAQPLVHHVDGGAFGAVHDPHRVTLELEPAVKLHAKSSGDGTCHVPVGSDWALDDTSHLQPWKQNLYAASGIDCERLPEDRVLRLCCFCIDLLWTSVFF